MVSTSILVAQATDNDQTGTVNALITYTIIGDNETLETFDIDSDGVISNKVELVSISIIMPTIGPALSR